MKLNLEIKNNKLVGYRNRGMSFEKEIDESNRFYEENNIALITKRATPIKVKKVENDLIVEAKFSETSYLDFDGVYNGEYIAIEAKETREDKYFPLSNLRDIQVLHIRKLVSLNAKVFLFVNFVNINKYYLLPGSKLIEFLNSNERKSIPIEYFNRNGHEVPRTLRPPLDYLKFIK